MEFVNGLFSSFSASPTSKTSTTATPNQRELSRVNVEMQARRQEYCQQVESWVFYGTWNVSGQPITDIHKPALTNWLVPLGKPRASIYAIGIQDIPNASNVNVSGVSDSQTEARAYTLQRLIRECLDTSNFVKAGTKAGKISVKTITNEGKRQKHRFALVANQSSVGLLLLVFVNERYLFEIQDVRSQKVLSGGQLFPSDGAVVVHFTCKATSFCFICAHFSETLSVSSRNDVINDLMSNTLLDASPSSNDPNGMNSNDETLHERSQPQLPKASTILNRSWIASGNAGRRSRKIFDSDYIFLMGDLNYGTSKDSLSEDLLLKEMEAGNVLPNFKDVLLVDDEPSCWARRILWCCNLAGAYMYGFDGREIDFVRLHYYASCRSPSASLMHRPVCALFSTVMYDPIRLDEQLLYKELVFDAGIEYDGVFPPELRIVSDRSIDFGNIVFRDRFAAKKAVIIIENPSISADLLRDENHGEVHGVVCEPSNIVYWHVARGNRSDKTNVDKCRTKLSDCLGYPQQVVALYTKSPIPWLTFNPCRGVLNPGQRLEITVRIDIQPATLRKYLETLEGGGGDFHAGVCSDIINKERGDTRSRDIFTLGFEETIIVKVVNGSHYFFDITGNIVLNETGSGGDDITDTSSSVISFTTGTNSSADAAVAARTVLSSNITRRVSFSTPPWEGNGNCYDIYG